MLMEQITNHLIEIAYLNTGRDFRNAAFRKTARNKYLFSEEINVWYPAALASQELKKGWPKDFRCSVKSCWIRVFFSPKHRLGRCQGSEQERSRCLE